MQTIRTPDERFASLPDYPFAPHYQKEWASVERRRARFAAWRLDHPPGEIFRYHLSANFWPNST